MPTVWIPPLLRDLTGGRETIPVVGATVGEVIDALEQLHPGIRERLCASGNLRPGLAAFVDTEAARQGLAQPVGPDSEVHFLPAIGGGSPAPAGALTCRPADSAGSARRTLPCASTRCCGASGPSAPRPGS